MTTQDNLTTYARERKGSSLSKQEMYLMPSNGNSFEKDPETGYLIPTHNTGSTVFGVESKKKWLEQFEECGSEVEASKLVGVSYTTFHTHRELDEAFARDYAIALRKMESSLKGVMYKNGHKPQGYMDRITWLRKHFTEWNPKSTVSVSSNDDVINKLHVDLVKDSDGVYKMDGDKA